MFLVSAWAGLSMSRGVGSQLCFLLARSLSSWSPITASWRPTARAALSLILKESHTMISNSSGVKKEKHKTWFCTQSPPKNSSHKVCCLRCDLSKLYYHYYDGCVPEVHVKRGTRVHLTRSSLEGHDTTRLSRLLHHLVFWEPGLCKVFMLLHVRENACMTDNGSTVRGCLSVILASLPTFINRLCKYWVMWPG